jgi:hypothetical protein
LWIRKRVGRVNLRRGQQQDNRRASVHPCFSLQNNPRRTADREKSESSGAGGATEPTDRPDPQFPHGPAGRTHRPRNSPAHALLPPHAAAFASGFVGE